MAWLSKYSSNPFVRNVAVMFSGNGLALIIPFIIAPFISRIYTPEDFGAFELFVRIMGLIAIVGSLRLEFAILLPKDRNEVLALVKLCLRILVIVTLVSTALILPFRNQIGVFVNSTELPDLLWLLPIGVLSLGGFNIMNQYLIKSQSFKEAAIEKIVSASSNNLSKFILGLSIPNSFSLVVGQIVGSVLPLFAVLRLKRMREMLAEAYRLPISGKVLIKKYKDFPLINTFHAFFHEGQHTVLLFLISGYYGEIALGLFGFAFRYLRVPLIIFGTSIGQVLNEKWSRDLNENRSIKGSVIRIVLFLGGTAFIPFTILFFYGEPIFTFVFGSDWTQAGVYAEILAPWLFINFMSSPISSIPILVQRQPDFFKMSVISGLLNLGLLAVMSEYGYDFIQVLWTLSGLNVVILLFVLFWIIRVGSIGRRDVTL
ncbi:oligosaccharide flippase family protein [Cryomorphaceae bacterium 1068]|nr:oligosaccharide flippase family protein [Cryomorphaceae bacterium 1068]